MLRILFILFVTMIVSSVQAQDSTPSYIIELEQIEASPEAKIQTVSEEVQNKLQEQGFVISSQKESSFIFSISDTNVDFSDIISARQKLNSTLLTVNDTDTYSYQIIGSLKEPFQTSLGELIPQTSKGSYGWGYHLSGPDVVSEFNDETYFRIFDEKSPVIFSGSDSAKGEHATKLTFKVQVPPEQKEGNYTGVIKVIALPKL